MRSVRNAFFIIVSVGKKADSEVYSVCLLQRKTTRTDASYKIMVIDKYRAV